MNWWKGMAVLLFSALLLWVCVLPSARADVWNKKTVLTFSEPVEVPGLTLQPGTYVFKLMDSTSNRNIVQIFDQDETHLYATILAIPDYRLEPADQTVVMFSERPSGSPQAVQAWFYPGDNYGQAFVYPESRALELAKATNRSIPTMPSETSSTLTTPAQSSEESQVETMKNAEVGSVGPSGEETEVSQGTPESQTQPQTQPSEAEKSTSELPKTASPVPLVALIGMLLVASATALRVFLKRTA
jgi:hypothetical protein